MTGMALELSVLGRSVIDSKALNLKRYGQKSKLSGRILPRAELHCPVALSSSKSSNLSFRFRRSCEFSYRSRFMLFSSSQCHEGSQQNSDSGEKELESIKVRELAEKEPENGVFRMLRSDVTRFLTTILIGTIVVNIAATALVTEAATAIFGEAGVSAATGLMTVAILLLTEITPKSVAVHNAQEVARLVVRPVAWLSLILYPVGRIVTYLSMGILKILGLKGRSEPYVTEDELKLMLRGAELSGAIEEEEQV